MSEPIYLDFAATTPVDEVVVEKMLPFFSQCFGNASSPHSFGRQASEAVLSAREKVAEFFSAEPQEIIFTSGASESNNLAIKGIVKKYYQSVQKQKPHLITTTFEHHSVLDTCKALQKEGLAEVTFVHPEKDGLINLSLIQKALQENTLLISVMYVNNEIGTVQPISELGEFIKKQNAQKKDGQNQIFFHTDATQAAGYFDCDANLLGADLISISAHKIYGPKGAGALFCKKDTPLARIQDGGEQENKKRAGTLNVPGIVGLAKAIEFVKERKSENERISELRDYLIKRVLGEIEKVTLNGSREKRSPNNANFSFENIEGESLILSLDLEGIAASTGSACTSGSLHPSHVLLSIGLKPEQAHGSLRLTLGRTTTKAEIDKTVEALKSITGKLRKVSGQVLQEYYQNAQNSSKE